MDTPIYDEAAFDNGFTPMPAACPRCVPGSGGSICRVCAAELTLAIRDDDHPLVSVYYNAHSPSLHTYPADVTR